MRPPDRATQEGYNPTHFAKALHNSVQLMPGAIAVSIYIERENREHKVEYIIIDLLDLLSLLYYDISARSTVSIIL